MGTASPATMSTATYQVVPAPLERPGTWPRTLEVLNMSDSRTPVGDIEDVDLERIDAALDRLEAVIVQLAAKVADLNAEAHR